MRSPFSRTRLRRPLFFFLLACSIALAGIASPVHAHAQDWVRTGTNLGVEKIRIAVADFKPVGADPQAPQFKQVFDQTLYSDLNNAGIFDLVSKSFNPQSRPGSPQEMQLAQWSGAPANASMVAFGALNVEGGRVIVYGWLFDAKNTGSPQVLGKQYSDIASAENSRTIAHRFADEIIFRLGGGIPGIAESKIVYVSARSGSKEIWEMDYDGQNQRPITHLGTISLSPHLSPDGSRIAFYSLSKQDWHIQMYSIELNRLVNFQGPPNSISPAWSSDGTHLAISSARSGDNEIYTCDATGGGLHRITQYRGPDVSPVWNPKTGGQIAWISGRTNLPQLYIMDSDGANVQRMTDSGYATSPSWSPNGQFLAFAWDRKYGPGAPGGQDIYVIDIASKRWVQLTHDFGRNDFPSWSPDGRHIVFESSHGGGSSVFSMLADGTHIQQLTKGSSSSMPNWSWK